MQTKRSWRNRALTLTVLTVLVGLPELASAQQSGLFPNAPIRRQRTPCNQEDPAYKLYRNQYYGYHPTCWRRFPDGWGCPSPEAPDKEKSFREIKPRPPEGLDADLDDEGKMKANDDREAPADNTQAPRPSLPPVPENSKPLFNLDNPDQGPAPGGNAPGAGQTTPPRTSRRSQGNGREPLAPMERQANGRSTGGRPRSRDVMDDRPVLAMSDDSEAAPVDADNLEPISDEPNAMPEVDVANPSTSSSSTSSQGRRGGMLSSLFGGTGWSWRRR